MCKNEEQFAKRWVDSMKEADMLVVMDTGSTDNTISLLRSAGVTVYTEVIAPWRWDTARERSLSYVPDDVDICVATDLDDVWVPGWRALLENAWNPGTTRVRHLYNYALLPDGRPLNQNFYHSRIHARQGYKWTRANHEYLLYIGEGQEKIADVKGLTLNHYPDQEKSRSFNLELTKLALLEDPDDIDILNCLGLDYYNNQMYDEAREAFFRFLKHPKAEDQELRCQAMCVIAKSYEVKQQIDESYCWFFRAIAEDRKHRDVYVELAMTAYRQMDWHTTLFGVWKALEITEVSSSFGCEVAYGHIPCFIASLASCALGMFQEALKFAKQALELSPGDEQLQQNIQNIERLMADTSHWPNCEK